MTVPGYVIEICLIIGLIIFALLLYNRLIRVYRESEKQKKIESSSDEKLNAIENLLNEYSFDVYTHSEFDSCLDGMTFVEIKQYAWEMHRFMSDVERVVEDKGNF